MRESKYVLGCLALFWAFFLFGLLPPLCEKLGFYAPFALQVALMSLTCFGLVALYGLLNVMGHHSDLEYVQHTTDGSLKCE